jgi:hypothetical protein
MFPQPSGNPKGLPPSEVKIKEVHVEPWPDSRRVRVHVELTPFSQRPNLEADITDEHSNTVASVSIIETMQYKLVFTMHLRTSEEGHFRLKARISYPDLGIVDETSLDFILPTEAH